MKYSFSKISKGFTLLETLVAIAMLTIVIATVTGLIQTSLVANANAKDEVTAKYLAEEGIEYLRNLRDVNIINNGQDHWMDGIAGDGSSPCGYVGSSAVTSTCYVDPINSTSPVSCNGVCPVINFDPNSGEYSYNSSLSNSKFTRTITVVGDDGVASGNPTSVYSVKVSSTITWMEGTNHLSYTATEYLFKWYTNSLTGTTPPVTPPVNNNIASIIATVENADGSAAPSINVQITPVQSQSGISGSKTTGSAGTVEFDSNQYGFLPGDTYNVTATDPNTNSPTLPQTVTLNSNTPTNVTITLSTPTPPSIVAHILLPDGSQYPSDANSSAYLFAWTNDESMPGGPVGRGTDSSGNITFDQAFLDTNSTGTTLKTGDSWSLTYFYNLGGIPNNTFPPFKTLTLTSGVNNVYMTLWDGVTPPTSLTNPGNGCVVNQTSFDGYPANSVVECIYYDSNWGSTKTKGWTCNGTGYNNINDDQSLCTP